MPLEQVKVVLDKAFLGIMTTSNPFHTRPPTKPEITARAIYFQIVQVNQDHIRYVKTFHSHLIMIQVVKS